MTASALTPARAAVLVKVAASGATRESPLRLNGAEFKAGLWLYEHDLLGLVGSIDFDPVALGPTVRLPLGATVSFARVAQR